MCKFPFFAIGLSAGSLLPLGSGFASLHPVGPVQQSVVARSLPAKESASSANPLVYSPSPTISASVRQELQQRLMAADPDHAKAISSTLSNDRIWQGFVQALERNGGSATNVADVMAAYYVSSWEIVHREEAGMRRFQGVRRQFASALTSKPELIGDTNAEKQKQAEGMGLQMGIFSAGAWQMLERGDERGFTQIQEAVRYTVLMRDGIDLKRFRLTEQGLTPG